MNAAGQKRERQRLARAAARKKFVHFVASGELQLAAEFAVEGMLDHHIRNRAALIDRNVEFFPHGRRIVAAGNGLLKEGHFQRRCEQIAAGGRNDVVSRSAEQGDIAHDALTAQVVSFGECRSTHRFLAFGELRENVGSSRVVLHGLPPEMLFSQYNSKRIERKRAFFCNLFIILQSKGGKG